MAYKVLIVDDQRVARQLFEGIVKESGRYELAGSLSSAREAADLCREKGVDLVLMDVVLSDGYHGLEASREIREKSPRTKIIVVTSMPEVSYLERAREIGVDSFWYKEIQEQPLLTLMDRTMAGERVYPSSTPRLVLGSASSVELTERELEVLREMTTGATNAEIGERLHLSERTVKRHITDMLEKTGYKNRTVLAINARVHGLVIGEGGKETE